ncbi:MAG TPA: hypothetical protein VFU71_18010 [Burkholderiaceae bacterium]|nr:hypothetical protein [Burkholderiaceae bacterium]
MINKPEMPDRERQMAEFSVGHDGLRYHYNGYRYDKWQDAVAYARLMRERPSQANARGSFVPSKKVAPTTEAEQAQMVSLGIRFDDGAYRFRDFRYDGLADAVNYAKREPPRNED